MKVPFSVKASISDLSIRKGLGSVYDRVQFILIGMYTIMEVRNGKGRWSSKTGWKLFQFMALPTRQEMLGFIGAYLDSARCEVLIERLLEMSLQELNKQSESTEAGKMDLLSDLLTELLLMSLSESILISMTIFSMSKIRNESPPSEISMTPASIREGLK